MKGGRFLVPALPAATVLVFLAFEAALERWRAEAAAQRRVRLTAIAFVVVLGAPTGVGAFAPAWRLDGGVGDGALVARGGYQLSPVWTRAVPLADCVPPGQSVAYSEAGLFGYEHLGLHIVDLRGLTSGPIARRAPRQDKYPWGVQDPNWYRADSPVGRVLLEARPQMIISFDASADNPPGSSILAGLYRRSAAIPVPGADKTLFVYLRRGFSCRARGTGGWPKT